MNTPGRLSVTTPTDTEVVLTRTFDAPAAMVFDALTRPDLLRRWLLGPPGWTMPVCDVDLRVGGAYRHVWRNGADGSEMAMSGVFREVAAPSRLVRTERFEFGCDAQAAEQLGTAVLAERDGRTTLTITVRYGSKAARDGAINSGMEHSIAAGYARLDELFAAPAVA